MKKYSPLVYVLGAIFTVVIAAIFSWTDFLVYFNICAENDKKCVTEINLWAIGVAIGVGAIITLYNYTFRDQAFKTRLVEFFKIPKSNNIRLSSKAIKKNRIILIIKNVEWRWMPSIPIWVFIRPVEHHPDWEGDFSKLDFHIGRNDVHIKLYWLQSKTLNFIKVAPSENAFYLDSDSNKNIKFQSGKKHFFIIRVYCLYNGKNRVFRESEVMINYKGGHQVELEIKKDTPKNKNGIEKFSYKQRHF